MTQAKKGTAHDNGNCGKKNRQGQPCSLIAGWGTPHKGLGACRFHGGCNPIKHGLYSKYRENLVSARIIELIEDPDLLDLRRPVALLEALMERLLEKAAESNIIGQAERQALKELAVEQSKAMERYYKVTEGTTHTIRVENIQVFLVQIAAVINEEISNPKTRARIAERMAGIRVIPD